MEKDEKVILTLRTPNGENYSILSNTPYIFIGEKLIFNIKNGLIVGECINGDSEYYWTSNEFYTETYNGKQLPILCK